MARPTRDQHEKNVCYFWLVYEDWFWTVMMLNSVLSVCFPRKVQAHAREALLWPRGSWWGFFSRS
ncbi:unnamed protein product [Pylaiella littoralis]